VTARGGQPSAFLEPQEQTVAPSQLGRVVFWMTGALLSFSISALAIRGVADRLNIFEILAIRSSFGAMILLLIAAARRCGRSLRRDGWGCTSGATACISSGSTFGRSR